MKVMKIRDHEKLVSDDKLLYIPSKSTVQPTGSSCEVDSRKARYHLKKIPPQAYDMVPDRPQVPTSPLYILT
jgi:hypothetical protein